MKYKTRFVISNLLYTLCGSIVLGRLGANLILSIFYNTIGSQGLLVNIIIETLIRLIMLALVYSVSADGAARFAAKKDFAPDYDEMKKFATIYFSILAGIEFLYMIFNTMSIIREATPVYSYFSVGELGSLNTLIAMCIISGILQAILFLAMIKVTLYLYDRY